MSTLREQFGWTGARTIDATTATLDFPAQGCPEVVIEIESSTDLQVKVEWIGGAGVAQKTRSIVKRGASTEEIVDPDTATAVLAAQDRIIVPTEGAELIRITRTAGSGSAGGVAVPSGSALLYALLKLIDGGLSATITGVSTEAKQDTQITVLGATTDAAVSTDANGSINAHIRGLVVLLVNFLTRLPAALAALGGLKVEKIGVSCHSFIVDGTDELLISAAARRVYGVSATHRDATPISIKLYDKATAASEADTPIRRFQVPANATAALGGGANFTFAEPIVLTNGLSIRATVGAADADDTALTSGEAEINTDWSA